MTFKGAECSICLEGYNDKDKFPRMLSCGHSFCSSCLEILLDGNTIRCPKCRSLIVVSTGVAGLLKNFDLLKIVDNQPKLKQAAKNTGRQVCEPCSKKHPATFCCLDCKENMCDTAAQIHKSSKLSRDHRVVTFKELKANPQLALRLFSARNITINSAFSTKIVVLLSVETVTPLITTGISV